MFAQKRGLEMTTNLQSLHTWEKTRVWEKDFFGRGTLMKLMTRRRISEGSSLTGARLFCIERVSVSADSNAYRSSRSCVSSPLDQFSPLTVWLLVEVDKYVALCIDE